jgi:biopolymer transport protein ExbD
MAISLGSDGKRRRKAVDAGLNLVPYIDLLTCMVAFLLITALWSQLARLEVAQKGQGQSALGDDRERLRVAVLVSAESFYLVVKDDQKPIPKREGSYDYAHLVEELRAVKGAHPDLDDLQVLSEDGIVFETLVKTMDAALTAGFPALRCSRRGPSLERMVAPRLRLRASTPRQSPLALRVRPSRPRIGRVHVDRGRDQRCA